MSSTVSQFPADMNRCFHRKNPCKNPFCIFRKFLPAAQFLGVELVNEKELVLIVARTPEKNRIMKAIMDGAGPKAGAIVFSLPVTDTAGLRLLEDEEPVQETSAQ